MKLFLSGLGAAGRERPLPIFSNYRFYPLLVFLFSLLVSFVLWRNAQTEAEHNLQTEFQYDIQETLSRITHQMQIYADMLRGVRGLYAASRSVERDEFRQYVNSLNLRENFPGVQGVGFSMFAPQQRKEGLEREVRREGYPAFGIFPPGDRDAYAPVIFIEPSTAMNLRAFGYDTYSERTRRETMERVRDTGECQISPKIHLVQEGSENGQSGFIMWLPVYRNGMPHETEAQRRTNLLGWVSAPFRAGNLFASLFRERRPRVNFEIYDGGEITASSLMYRTFHDSGNNSGLASHFKSDNQVQVAGRTWTFRFSSLPEFDRRLLNQKPRSIALAGITISVLLALITWMLVQARSRAQRAADALQRELQERKRAEAGMRLTENVMENVDTAVLVTDTKSVIIRVNPAFSVITGYGAEEAVGRKTSLLSSGAHPPEFYREMWKSLSQTGSWQGEIYNRRKNGEFYTEWLSINEVRDEDGKLTNYVAMFSDISERKAAEAHMLSLAHYDPLTGLPNRTLLADRLQQAIVAAKREKTCMVVMFIDLDNFKPINDKLGHHTGDILLKEVAVRMQDCLRESDTAARIGGDEFVVLLPAVENEQAALAVAEKIRKALDQTFTIMGNRLDISASIGVAVYPEHGHDEKNLLRNADTAMYKAKENGRNRVVRYDATMIR